MNPIDPDNSVLMLIDFQQRLMPAIDRAQDRIANAARLLAAARLLSLPAVHTEQNPRGLGPTVPELAPEGPALAKMSFDALAEDHIAQALPPSAALVVAGCEAHICVMQTVLAALRQGRRVHVVADAVGSRSPENHAAALARMAAAGADVVTVEMVLFEWLRSAGHPAFRQVAALIR
ncbi:isochorismatase family protein [uncultured Paracoccus sp.]|uniref:isochorismatase family protein n=1 Tax=uncultured Paracoccus sp. TaxID=189685 RepID=UPI0025D95070|nr:isochorismatase family protein [uncultured Paracoccus sp.]